ncbi:probable RNA-binding protein EIF1AD [Electrophorus electricus]|nr:probable RNA-binding protein EIF1AD [Electrophorus electricus]XP_026859408.1 probable RNA-binding protein EIF1AD [Electrophorus electricus]XP_026859409.1 probable RNA-binding protein EIF1AD [Electrophorus electricus]XP_026859410.1 probable RNA-binding protein EIF1AD [Electrophorus electricus]
MSQATKRKHVVKEVLGDYVTPSENQQIMRILGTNGNNLHEAVTESGERFLLSMPTKFRKNIWIKRGDFVIIDPIEEGDKVKGEISFILYRDHIQYLKKLGVWPKGFMTGGVSEERKVGPEKEQSQQQQEEEEERDGSDTDDDLDLFVNTNRAAVLYSESDEDLDEEEEEEEQEEENK